MKTVAVIFGGQSSEHEVSCVSARFIISTLREAGFSVLPIVVTLAGTWHRGADAEHYLQTGNVPASSAHTPFLPGTAEPGIDVVFPIIHGATGEDGWLQGLLEWCGLPFVGAGVRGSVIAMDKIMQKTICRAAGIPVTDWTTEAAQAHLLGFPLFVKPANAGSSVGITKVHAADELGAAIQDAQQHDARILFEKTVPNARELEIAVLGQTPLRTSVIGEVTSSNEFYDYAAKYLNNASITQIPADLPNETAREIAEIAQRTCAVIDVDGLARVDFLLSRTTGALVLNEVNTLPGFTPISMYPKLWAASGKPATELVTELVRLAEERFARHASFRRITPLSRWWIPA